jgi:hypothetical protein
MPKTNRTAMVVHRGTPRTNPIPISATAWDLLTRASNMEPQPSASAACKRACKIVPASDVWLGLMELGAETSAQSDPGQSIQRFQRSLRSVGRSLSKQAEKLGAKVPHHELWELEDDCGRGVRAVRLLEQAAQELAILARGGGAKKGRRPSYSRWVYVQEELLAARFTFGQLTKLVLSSDEDWDPPPCESLVANYAGPTYGERTGSEKLKERLEKLHDRRTKPMRSFARRQITLTVPVRILSP